MKGLAYWHRYSDGLADTGVGIFTDEIDLPHSKKGKIRNTIERVFETIQLKKVLIELSCKLTVFSFQDSRAIQEE